MLLRIATRLILMGGREFCGMFEFNEKACTLSLGVMQNNVCASTIAARDATGRNISPHGLLEVVDEDVLKNRLDECVFPSLLMYPFSKTMEESRRSSFLTSIPFVGSQPGWSRWQCRQTTACFGMFD